MDPETVVVEMSNGMEFTLNKVHELPRVTIYGSNKNKLILRVYNEVKGIRRHLLLLKGPWEDYGNQDINGGPCGLGNNLQQAIVEFEKEVKVYKEALDIEGWVL
jgi:hypothetical protein